MASEAVRARKAAWFRAYYDTTLRAKRGHLKGAHCGRNGCLDPAEARAIKIVQVLQSHIDAVDAHRIKMAFCKKCGNHRAFDPDIDGKCGACRRRLRHAQKARKRQSDPVAWGAKKRLYKQRRRALRRANGGAGTVTMADWEWVLEKYGTACLCCGDNCNGKPTMDHVVPLALGGPHDKTNLQPLCALCNSVKGAAIMDYRPDRPLAPLAKDPRVVKYV